MPSIDRLKSPRIRNGTPSCRRAAIHSPQQLRLVEQFPAGQTAGAHGLLVAAALLQVHRQNAQIARAKMQRDIRAAAQMAQAQARNVRVAVVTQATADGDADPLRHPVPGHVDRVLVAREQPGRRAPSVHLLDRHEVGIEVVGIACEAVEILGRAGRDVGGQEPVAGLASRQPVQVPGGDLQLRGQGEGREQQDQQGQ
ncbi:MAG: hypothetical protein ACJ8AI_02665 [Rhodopila sp.]